LVQRLFLNTLELYSLLPITFSCLGLLPTEWVDLSEKLSERLAKEEVGGFSTGRKVAQIS